MVNSKPARRKVTHVEFAKAVLLEKGNSRPVRTLDVDGYKVDAMSPIVECPEMWLDGTFLVIGNRRWSLHGPAIESIDVADE